jgi:predicted ATP-grasp superfamily ATP-dependent carboligase
VAQVEFLEDERDGRLKLMEVNPRFWDSLQMAIQAGVDFPRLLYEVATRGDVPPRLEYRAGEVCRSILPGELLYLLTSWNRLHMGPSFWRLFGPGVGHCLWDRRDPRPFLAFFGIAARGLFHPPTLDAVFHRL